MLECKYVASVQKRFVTGLVLSYKVTTLVILLMPIEQLYFQISNSNVFVYVTLAYIFKVSIVTVFNCNVSCHRVSRLFALRQLKKCVVSPADIILIYFSLIRSIVEYASVVFADLPGYLSDSLESIQKRALCMIWLGRPYSNSLDKAGLVSLSERRAKVSTGFVQKITPGNIIYNLIHQSVVQSTDQYNLRPGRTKYPIPVTTERFKNVVTMKYQTII